MSSYDSMAGAMSAAGAYSLDGTTYVDSELEVYAEELDALSEEIGLIIRECIVATAENEGLRFYETLVGSLNSNLSTEKRREMIISLMNLSMNDNTKDGIKLFFKSLGVECEIVENPEIFNLYISISSGSFSTGRKRYIINRAKAFLPCHLTFTVDFRTSTWADYDSMGRTFEQIDALGLTWEEFEFRNV